MEQSPLPSLERPGHPPLTRIQRMLAAEIVNISLTDRPQAAPREIRPTSAPPRQPGGQGPGSSADQVRRQDERAAQIAFYSRRAISIVSRTRSSESVGTDRNNFQPYTNAHDAVHELDQGDARRIQSYIGRQDPLGPVLPVAGRVPRHEHNERMWLRFRFELLRLESGLATEFSNPVKSWIHEVIQSWRGRQSRKEKEN